MSRAFVTDKEDWFYCVKAGERCMHAESGKICSKTDCEYFDKEAQRVENTSGGLQVVSRREGKTTVKANELTSRQPRTTKKSSLTKPQRWGGRNG